jgi:hypothetical protein
MKVPLEAEAIADASEFLAGECARGDCTYGGLVETWGPPTALARAYRDQAAAACVRFREAWCRHAPGWRLTCLSCGRTGELPRNIRLGWRIGAASLLALRLGYCRECRRPRVLRLWRARG